ncbi:hypothetical protein L1987_18195 [Smallanthus sonchifolius]|uniref:Uncharacterized protein n=1 Tax=Smallanthus sonchifolius TaxID=185202 RepID=A0ACB9J1N1_9ASTR|nr:hypothetical protein L1987_18195 [Smallanthus sonchifolius]
MSDGESSKEVEPCVKRSKNDEFVQAIAWIVVAQVCESVGFQQSALDTFSDAAYKYVSEIGKVSGFYAGLAGQSELVSSSPVQG